MTVQEQTLLTTVDMSRLLRCSLQSVYRMTRSGALPSVRIGGLIRYRPADVERFIEAGQRKGGCASVRECPPSTGRTC